MKSVITKIVGAFALIAILFFSYGLAMFVHPNGAVMGVFAIGVPLILAMVVEGRTKSKAAFWNTIVAGWVVAAALLYILMNFGLTGSAL